MAVNEAALKARRTAPDLSARKRFSLGDLLKRLKKAPWKRISQVGGITVLSLAATAVPLKALSKGTLPPVVGKSSGYSRTTEFVASMKRLAAYDQTKFKLKRTPDAPQTPEDWAETLNRTVDWEGRMEKPGTIVFNQYNPERDEITEWRFDQQRIQRDLSSILDENVRSKLAVRGAYFLSRISNDLWGLNTPNNPNANDAWVAQTSRAILQTKNLDSLATPEEMAEFREILAQIPPQKLEAMQKKYAPLHAAVETGGTPLATALILLLTSGAITLTAVSELRRNPRAKEVVRRAIESGQPLPLDEALRQAGVSKFDRMALSPVPGKTLDATGFKEAIPNAETKPTQIKTFARKALRLASTKHATGVPPFPLDVSPVHTAIGVSHSRKISSAPKIPVDFLLLGLFMAENFGSSRIYIADAPAVRNRMALYGEARAQAEKMVERDVQAKTAALQGLLTALKIPRNRVKVMRWAHLEQNPVFQQNLEMLNGLARTNPKFRKNLADLIPKSVKRIALERARETVEKSGVKNRFAAKRAVNAEYASTLDKLAEYALADLAYAAMPGMRIAHAREDAFNEQAEKIMRRHGIAVSQPSKLKLNAATTSRMQVDPKKAKKWFLQGAKAGLEAFDWLEPRQVLRSRATGLNYMRYTPSAGLTPNAPPEHYLPGRAGEKILTADSEETARQKISASGREPDELFTQYAETIPSLRAVKNRGGSVFNAVMKIVRAANQAAARGSKTPAAAPTAVPAAQRVAQAAVAAKLGGVTARRAPKPRLDIVPQAA